MANPYTISFGMEPRQMIQRPVQKAEILDNFSAEYPSAQVFMITGVRGTGKTVLLTDIASELAREKDWITLELNPERDLLNEFAANLANETSLARIFQNAKINLSFFGMGLEVTGEAPITDIEVALEKMLSSLKKRGKRILIGIDEVTNTKTVREFTAAFQIFLRKKLPVFLLMTGLYENIYELQNEKSLTFLYRAPKVVLEPLNIGAIASNYAEVFDIEREQALKMAAMTRGYSFAFQTLGFLTWEAGGDYTLVTGKYRQYLEDYVYDKIWAELSAKERQILISVARSDDGRILGIRSELNMTTNQFNPYRSRLIRKGLLDGRQRGLLTFVLPMFKEFVLDRAEME